MPSVELVDGKWVKVDGVRAEDLDGTTAPKPAPPTPPKPAKVKAVAPTGLTAKQQKEITSPKASA